MNYRQKLGYTVLGAVIMLIGLGIGAIVTTPLVAQNDGLFDEIQCSRLTVVDNYGKPAVILSSNEVDGNFMLLYNLAGKRAAVLLADDNRAKLSLYNQAGKDAVRLESFDGSRDIALYDESGNKAIGLIAAEDFGRMVQVFNKEGKLAVELLALSEPATNAIHVRDEAEQPAIGLFSDTRSNRVKIFDMEGNVRWKAP